MSKPTTSTSGGPAILWFRDDLRLADNPALCAAVESGRPLLCIFVHDTESEGLRPLGGAARWWLHGALEALGRGLKAHHGALHLLRGAAEDVVLGVATQVGAGALYWNRRYDGGGRAIDKRIKAALHARGISAQSFNGSLLYEPWTVATRAGTPFGMFGAYWRAARGRGEPPSPLAEPRGLTFFTPSARLAERAADLHGLDLLPRHPDWAGGLRAMWTPGEAGAKQALVEFTGGGLRDYAQGRDRPDMPATSRLSPHLRFGSVSPRQLWYAAGAAAAADEAREADRDKFLLELGWREFSYHLLYHEPDLGQRNHQRRFDAMPWRTDAKALHAWQRGRTGYPLVDAGMRELWTTGWMHNRVRMVVASFLTKHLLIDWRVGEAWFWDTLVDADSANNPANWQWVAGSGADAAPYFRIFNPTLQAEKFDPDGAYVRRWVPELAGLPDRVIHRPWAAPQDLLAAAEVQLGETYPSPIVEHGAARHRALDVWHGLAGR